MVLRIAPTLCGLAFTAAALPPVPLGEAAEAKLAFEGRWSLRSVADCRSRPDELGENVPHAFSRTELVFYESTCRVRAIERHGDAFVHSTLCRGEGETWRSTFRLRPIGRDRLERTDDAGPGKVLYTRCGGSGRHDAAPF